MTGVQAPGTWLLLRGLTRESGHWGDFPELLAATLPPGAMLLPLDLPGNGPLHAKRSPDTVHGMMEAVRAEVARLALAGPVHVLAMSLGAMVTVAWLQAYPAEVAGAVLINTSLRPFSPFWQRLRPRQYARVLRLALGADGGTWERSILAMTTRHPCRDQVSLLRHWEALRERHPVRAGNALRQLRAAARYRAGTAPLRAPVLVLRSLGDQLVNPVCSRDLALHWHLPLRTHPTAGHDLPLDAPHWVAGQIHEWLTDLQHRGR